jgi:hypothetical protein
MASLGRVVSIRPRKSSSSWSGETKKYDADQRRAPTPSPNVIDDSK